MTCHVVSSEICQGLGQIYFDNSLKIIFQLSGYNHCLFTLSDTSCDSCQCWKKFFRVEVDKGILNKYNFSGSTEFFSYSVNESQRLDDVDTDKIIDSP